MEIASVSAGAESITVTGKAIVVNLTAAAKTITALAALIAGSTAAAALITVAGTGSTALAVEGAITTAGGTDTAGLKLAANEIPFNCELMVCSKRSKQKLTGQ